MHYSVSNCAKLRQFQLQNIIIIILTLSFRNIASLDIHVCKLCSIGRYLIILFTIGIQITLALSCSLYLCTLVISVRFLRLKGGVQVYLS